MRLSSRETIAQKRFCAAVLAAWECSRDAFTVLRLETSPMLRRGAQIRHRRTFCKAESGIRICVPNMMAVTVLSRSKSTIAWPLFRRCVQADPVTEHGLRVSSGRLDEVPAATFDPTLPRREPPGQGGGRELSPHTNTNDDCVQVRVLLIQDKFHKTG